MPDNRSTGQRQKLESPPGDTSAEHRGQHDGALDSAPGVLGCDHPTAQDPVAHRVENPEQEVVQNAGAGADPADSRAATDSSRKGTLILQIPEPPPEAITAAARVLARHAVAAALEKHYAERRANGLDDSGGPLIHGSTEDTPDDPDDHDE